MLQRTLFTGGLLLLLGLTLCSLLTGASDLRLGEVLSDPLMREVMLISRVPRTLALLLAGSAISVAGLMMQMLTQNRFVEPSLVGTTQAAGLGLLLVMVLFPAATVLIKMSVAMLFALSGTGLFMLLIWRIRIKSSLMVPLAGMMLGAVFSALTTFLAMKFDLLQALAGWGTGDFSGVMQGRYELLWGTAFLTLLAALIADRFTLAGLGRDFSVNFGLNYGRTLLLGMVMIAAISGVVMVVVGALPFLGLVVPGLVSLLLGDNLRRTVPWTILIGALLTISCDIAGRLIIRPYEIPLSAMLGVVGALVFLLLILRSPRYGH